MPPSLALLSVFYLLSLGSLGAMVPFLSARLAASGLSPAHVGLVLAMLPVGRLLSAPVWGWLADRHRMGGLLLRVGCAIAFVGGLLMLRGDSPAMAAAGVLLFASGRVPLGPLVDAAVLDGLSAAGRDQRDYGRIRLWGSVGFLGVAWIAGAWAAKGGDPLLLGVLLLAATTMLAFRFPRGGGGGPAPILPALRALLGDRCLLPLLATSCLQALTLSTYDTFFSSHVQALGLPPTITSISIVIGVVLEVGIMRAGQQVLGRIGTANALLLAALVSIPRWALTAWVTDPVALVAIQALHGVSFGLFWIAAVAMMAERAPREVSASAQSLLAAASYGVGALIGALLAGELSERWDTSAIFVGLTAASTGAAVFAGWLVARARTEAAAVRAA